MKINYSAKKTGTPTGGNIAVHLAFNQSSSKLTTEITPFTVQGVRLPPITKTLCINGVENIEIDTSGANGAPGLHGEDGKPGAQGLDGNDANERRTGSNGGAGYPGQDGTPGTSGGPGGNGGHIVIQVNENDTDVLGIVQVNTKGGSGGAAGRHGVGGPGGPGGRGGRSYQWTTHEEVPVQVSKLVFERTYDPHQTCIDGIRYGDWIERSEYKTVTEYRTEYKRHFNPGGERGPNGPHGRTPTTPLYNGKPGKDGTLCVHVTTGRGNRTFQGIYNLSLVSFKAEPLAHNGIFEPGATIEVSDIVIKNTGLMPTPAHKRIKLRIADGNYISQAEQELYLLGSVEPGQQVRIKGTMQFVLHEIKGSQAAPYTEKKILDLAADLTRLKKQLSSFSNPMSIELGHPIEVEAVEAPASVLPGEVAKISVIVRNRSSQNLGAESLLATCKRAIYASLALAPESMRKGLGFCDAHGTRLAMPRCEAEIPVISAGGRVRVSWYMSLDGAAQQRRAHRINAALDLEKIGKSGELKRIEARPVDIVEGIGYQPTSSHDFLLVTNETTTPTELNAWKSVAFDLGLSFAVWDLSVHRHLSLSRPLEPSGKSTLLKDWQNKLIVVLNKQGTSRVPYPLMPFDRLPSADLDRALRTHRAKLYIFGAPYPESVRPSIAQPSETKVCQRFESADKVIERYRDAPPEVGTQNIVSIEGWMHPLSTNTDQVFSEALDIITRHFSKRFPRELFTISPAKHCELLKEIPFTGVKKVSWGHITIRRERVAAHGDILSGQVNNADISIPSTITSFVNKVLVLAAMPSETLAARAVKELIHPSPRGGVASALARALLYNTARDLAILAGEEAAASKSEIPMLANFSRSFISTVRPTALPSEAVWGELMGTLSCLKAHYAPWHKRLIPFSNSRSIAHQIDFHLNEMESHLLKVAGADAMTQYKERKKRVMAAFWASRPTNAREPITTWALTDPTKPSASPTVKPIRTNPYFVKSGAWKKNYDFIEKQICGLVEKELKDRSRQVTKPRQG